MLLNSCPGRYFGTKCACLFGSNFGAELGLLWWLACCCQQRRFFKAKDISDLFTLTDDTDTANETADLFAEVIPAIVETCLELEGADRLLRVVRSLKDVRRFSYKYAESLRVF